MKNLDEVKNFLNHGIDDINAGGCAISALAMHRWLAKNNQLKGDEFITYGYHDQSRSFVGNEKALSDRDSEPFACYHAFLHHAGNFHDAVGFVDPDEYTYRHDIHDFDFIVKSINTPHWNTWFNRQQVSTIQEFLGIDLSDIEIYF